MIGEDRTTLCVPYIFTTDMSLLLGGVFSHF